MKCPYCGKGTVYYGDTCPNPKCGRVVHDNTASLDQLWGKGNARRESSSSGGSFFSPGWAIPFKLIGLVGRGIWWLVKIPF